METGTTLVYPRACVCVQIGCTIHCRILRFNLKKFSVDLTFQSSDLAYHDNRFMFILWIVMMCVCVHAFVHVHVCAFMCVLDCVCVVGVYVRLCMHA